MNVTDLFRESTCFGSGLAIDERKGDVERTSACVAEGTVGNGCFRSSGGELLGDGVLSRCVNGLLAITLDGISTCRGLAPRASERALSHD